jgi:hypothetical protein
MTPAEMRAALSLARDFHAGRIDLPPEIKETYRKIKEARRNAERFLLHFRVVDKSLVNEVVRLMLEKDRLYAEWAASEAKGVL